MTEKSIVLIGFMGVGKTSVGQLVAQKLNRPFIDIDQEIEKQYGMTINDIFTYKGEETFRKWEREMIESYCEKPHLVLSPGGGSFQQKQVRDICLENGIVIFLNISWEVWKKRLPILTDTRPNLQQRSLEEIKDLFERRKAFYAHHHVNVLTDYLTIEEVANNIIKLLEERGEC